MSAGGCLKADCSYVEEDQQSSCTNYYTRAISYSYYHSNHQYTRLSGQLSLAQFHLSRLEVDFLTDTLAMPTLHAHDYMTKQTDNFKPQIEVGEMCCLKNSI